VVCADRALVQRHGYLFGRLVKVSALGHAGRIGEAKTAVNALGGPKLHVEAYRSLSIRSSEPERSPPAWPRSGGLAYVRTGPDPTSCASTSARMNGREGLMSTLERNRTTELRTRRSYAPEPIAPLRPVRKVTIEGTRVPRAEYESQSPSSNIPTATARCKIQRGSTKIGVVLADLAESDSSVYSPRLRLGRCECRCSSGRFRPLTFLKTTAPWIGWVLQGLCPPHSMNVRQ